MLTKGIFKFLLFLIYINCLIVEGAVWSFFGCTQNNFKGTCASTGDSGYGCYPLPIPINTLSSFNFQKTGGTFCINIYDGDSCTGTRIGRSCSEWSKSSLTYDNRANSISVTNG
jgi:hypothetical protein